MIVPFYYPEIDSTISKHLSPSPEKKGGGLFAVSGSDGRES